MRDGPKLQGLGVASGMHGASLLEWGIAFRHGASLQGWGVVTSGKGRSKIIRGHWYFKFEPVSK